MKDDSFQIHPSVAHSCSNSKRKTSENTVYVDKAPSLVYSTVSQRAKLRGKTGHRLLEQTIQGKMGMAPSKIVAATKCFETCVHHLSQSGFKKINFYLLAVFQ